MSAVEIGGIGGSGERSALDLEAVVESVVEQAAGGEVRTERVEKLPEFFNGQGSYSSGMSEDRGEKPGPLFTEQDGIQKRNASARRGLPAALSPAARSAEQETGLILPAPAPLGKVGRPTVLTPELVEKLCMLLSVGFSRSQAAAYFGIDKSTIAHAAARDADLGRVLRRAEELNTFQSERTLIAAAQKNWRAAAWYLTFKAKHPAPLSEEEKEERHQAQLADNRRSAEAMNAYMNHATGREPATVSVERPARKPRGKKSVKG